MKVTKSSKRLNPEWIFKSTDQRIICPACANPLSGMGLFLCRSTLYHLECKDRAIEIETQN